MPRRTRRDEHGRPGRGAGAAGRRSRAHGRGDDRLADDGLGDLEPPDDVFRPPGPTVNVILTAHARRQLDDLGSEAEAVVGYLQNLDRDELMWMAERLPSQRGREVWLLWAGPVRVLFDLEEDDLTVQGFGLRPRF